MPGSSLFLSGRGKRHVRENVIGRPVGVGLHQSIVELRELARRLDVDRVLFSRTIPVLAGGWQEEPEAVADLREGAVQPFATLPVFGRVGFAVGGDQDCGLVLRGPFAALQRIEGDPDSQGIAGA